MDEAVPPEGGGIPNAAPETASESSAPLAPPEVTTGSNDAAPTTDGESSVSNVRIPTLQKIQPQWALQFSGSPKAFGLSTDGAFIRGFSIQMDYQPQFFQKFGVLGFGPSFNLYPVIPYTGRTDGPIGIFSLGAQIQYQARFFREQPIVPIVGYNFEYLRQKFVDEAAQAGWISGATLGAMILLNEIDPTESADFYVNYQVCRTYLIAELRNSSGRGEAQAFRSYFFGLRFEF